VSDHTRCMCGSEDFNVIVGVGRFCDFCGHAIERYDTVNKQLYEAAIAQSTGYALRLAAVFKWLEDNEPSVFARGLWDAVREAEALATRTATPNVGGEE
jgi:hypothetical protein